MKNIWSMVCREAPDAAGGAPAQVDSAAAENDAAAAAAAAATNEPTADALAPDPAPPPPVKKEAPAWAFKRISEESAKAQQAIERAQEAERRAAAAEALAARLQSGQSVPHDPQPQNNQIDPALIRAEAERIRFSEDVNDLRSKGYAEFGTSFNDTIAALGALGAATPEFVSDVLAIDKANAHKIFKTLAEDGERAVALAGMTSRQRIAELARMTIPTKAAEPAPKAPAAPARQVSAAPAPAPAVVPTTTKTLPAYSDELSDAEFTRQFNERQAARRAKR